MRICVLVLAGASASIAFGQSNLVKVVIAKPTNVVVEVVITNYATIPDPKPPQPTNNCGDSMAIARWDFAMADWYRRNGLTTNQWTNRKPQPPMIVRRAAIRAQTGVDESPGARSRKERNE